ncbi:hypothetical protein [Streptomyces sp. NPDC051636]
MAARTDRWTTWTIASASAAMPVGAAAPRTGKRLGPRNRSEVYAFVGRE